MVESAIESALNQGPEAEVIVVDDGSTDKSFETASAFEGVTVERTPNRGVSAARNQGLRLARGRFIKFLDSDDLLPPGSITAMFTAAKEQPPKHIVVGAAEVRAAHSTPQKYGYSKFIEQGPIPGALLLRYTMQSGLPLFPRPALEAAGGFNEKLSIGEDYELAARLHVLKYVFVQEPIVAYVLCDHEGERLSRNYGAAGLRKQIATFSAVRDVLVGASKDERISVGRAIWCLGREASRMELKPEAEQLFAMATAIATIQAHVGPLPLRLLYRGLPAYSSERMFEALKSVSRRFG